MKLDNIFIISNTVSDINELYAKASELTDSINAVFYGSEDDAKNLKITAENVYACKDDNIFDSYAFDIAEIIKQKESSLIFTNNTITTRSVAARIAAYIDAPIFTNVSDLELREEEVAFNQTVYGGAGIRNIIFTDKYGVLTFNSGSFEAKENPNPAENITFVEISKESNLKLVDRVEQKEKAVNLAGAKNIVDVGRGIADEKGLELAGQLAKAIDADLACSRPVAENLKLLPKAQYIGVTGVQVKPSFLLSVAVSGQIQHIAGMDKSKFVMAINKDKSAPIFKHCDVGIVGDIYDVIPKIIEKLS